MDLYSFQFDLSFSLNFGYHDNQLLIPQLSMTPSSTTRLHFDSPSSCFFVIIGGKYLKMIGKIMVKVNNVTNDIGGTRPMAVFLMTNYKENIDIDVDYGFERYKSIPVMVK